tara:strand:+ start:146 stop:367 length:222 start_codon:yes stop_codon:yes gene_type:complete
MIDKNNNQTEDYYELYGNLNDKISELNKYFDELLNELNKVNEENNSITDLIKLTGDIKTKVNLLHSTTLNEEE